MAHTDDQVRDKRFYALALGALGIVYGDIGTSPLYALRECFDHHQGLSLSRENILGVLSLIFWSLQIVICLKYMTIVLRGDNKGEGGILALMALVISSKKVAEWKKTLFVIPLSLFGAALLYGDGIITPAISVLSATEGLTVATPVFSKFVIPITIAIMAILFYVQSQGTGRIGYFFGPIISVWFISIGALGIYGIIQNPFVLTAVSPHYAIQFFLNNGQTGFFVMGSVFLVVTGGEALYADMGHFGRGPIRLAWFALVLPALLLNYFGQGALLLSNPAAIKNPFYLLAPNWAVLPLVGLATMAAVIASQALLSGVFSLTRQAVQLGFSPRLNIIHTSKSEIGQIYIPFINWALFIGVVWLVLTFKTSSNLAAAYGIAVTATMIITTILAYIMAVKLWNWPLWMAVPIFLFFGIVDLTYFIANIFKIPDGGWVPLALAIFLYLLMTTWRKGRAILAKRLKASSLSYKEFNSIIETNKPHRVSGTAIYMSGDPTGVPVPLLHNLKHNKVIHKKIVVLSVSTREYPFVDKAERISVEELGPGFYRVVGFYGFMETPKVIELLSLSGKVIPDLNMNEATFVLGRETILATGRLGMSIWREKIFALMAKNAQQPTTFFAIPPNQVMEVGIQIEI